MPQKIRGRLRSLTAFFLLVTCSVSFILPAPPVSAATAPAPTAKDIDGMMEKLRGTDTSYAEKKRIAAVVFVHQDVYRRAVIQGEFPAKSANVEAFLDYKSKLQADVAERMNMKHRNLTGENIKQPIIPFAYNNILSDDDVITGSGKNGKQLEKVYVESLDELVRERAGQPMSAADRQRIDVNGLAWDMTQKGGIENFWHKEKYINPQSGFANQQKLIEAGDKVKVMGFDENGKLITLQGEEAKKAILSLNVDKPLQIGDMNMQKGTGSMSDYARMAEIHQVKFKGTLTPDEIAQFIRNQKYTERVFGDFKDIAMKDNPALTKEIDSFLNTSNDIRKQTTARGVAEILQKEYGVKILNADGSVNFDKMKEAMQLHQNKQLTQAMPKMIGAVSANEAYKISQWLKGQGKNSKGRTKLRKQLALTYAVFGPDRMAAILADIDKIDIPAGDKAWLKNVLTNDATQIRKYAEMMRLSPEELVRHLGIDGDNMRAVDLLESMDQNVRTAGAEMTRRPGGKKFHEFLKSRTAKALNLDVMLDGSRNERVMLFSMMLLAVSRAYNASERNDEAIKKAGMAVFEMVPLVASILRFSEGEFKESFRELAMDIFPPLALAQIAFMALHWAGNEAKDSFTETVWEGLVNEALKDLTDDDFAETEMKYYRLRDREAYFEYLQEVEAGFGRVAKLSSMIAPEVDALMSRHPEVKANDAALYTCNYFEEFDVIDIRKSLTEKYSVEQIKSRFWAGGGPEALSSSASTPVERRAAWLIMENLKIRNDLHKQAIQNFIDRIEREYNRRKKGEEEVDPNGIVENTRQILKQMYEGAPDVIKNSEWAFPKLKEEYRRLLEYLKNYKVDGVDELVLKQEMQALIEDFRKFIDDLARAVDLSLEKASLNLSGIVFGGEKSQVPAQEVLLADPFRVAVTATVQAKRANVGWTIFYYISSSDSSGVKILGQKTVNSGQFSGGGEGMFVIDETSKATQFQIAKGNLLPDFQNEGEYSIFPVIGFGAWSDPIHQVGYEALNDPSEYPDLFEPDRVAFAGSPATFTLRKAKVKVKTPQTVYKNDKAKALAHLDVPEYARHEVTAEGPLKFSGPVNNILSKLEPEKLDPISMDPEKPTEIGIRMDEKAEEGTYYIELKARLRGFPDEAQPLPFMEDFDFVNQNNPLLGDDLTKLLEQMQGLEAQARGIFESMKISAEDFLSKIGEASSALAEARRLIAAFEPQITSLEQKAGPLLMNLAEIEKRAAETSRAGSAAAEAHSGAENYVLKTCETTKAMAGITDVKRLEAMLAEARTVNDTFTAQQSLFNEELEKTRLASVNAESLQKETAEATAEIKKEKVDTSKLLEAIQKSQAVISEGEGSAGSAEADSAKLSKIKDSAAALMGQAEPILKGIEDPAKRSANETLFQQMQGLYNAIQGYAASASGYSAKIQGQVSSLKEELAGIESKVTEMSDKAEALKYQIPDDAALAKAQAQTADAKAAYEAASVYGDPMAELSSSCGICLAEAEKIFSRADKDKDSLEDKDCSQMPGTAPRIKDGTGEVYCGCLNNQTWDQNQGRCMSSPADPSQQTPPVNAVDPQTQVAQANCSMYPGTAAQWNAVAGQVQCVCTSGTQWNGFSCVADPRTQVASADCSMYPNTAAQWNAAYGRVLCMCTGNWVWNGSQCVSNRPSGSSNPWANIFGQQGSGGTGRGGSNSTDCSAWPGTSAVWNAGAGSMQCVCPQNAQWNGSSCVFPDPLENLFGNQGSGGGNKPPIDLISPVAAAAAGGGPRLSSQPNAASCPAGTVNIGGTCYTQTSGGPVSGTVPQQPPSQGPLTGNQGSSGNNCPPGSINLLGVCSAT